LKGYFDSGFLFKLYWREPNSPAAFAMLQKFQPPLVMSRFNEIEMLHVARRKTWMVGPSGVPQMTAVWPRLPDLREKRHATMPVRPGLLRCSATPSPKPQ
jgi:hypothetical protein